jgi:hypothetical protein
MQICPVLRVPALDGIDLDLNASVAFGYSLRINDRQSEVGRNRKQIRRQRRREMAAVHRRREMKPLQHGLVPRELDGGHLHVRFGADRWRI